MICDKTLHQWAGQRDTVGWDYLLDWVAKLCIVCSQRPEDRTEGMFRLCLLTDLAKQESACGLRTRRCGVLGVYGRRWSCRTVSLSPTQQSLLLQTHKVPGRWERSRLLLPQATRCCCGATADRCPQRRLEAEATCEAETPPHSSRERSLMTYSSVGVVCVCVRLLFVPNDFLCRCFHRPPSVIDTPSAERLAPTGRATLSTLRPLKAEDI